MSFELKEEYNIDDLMEIVRILRSPEGCPWDRKQTHKSIRKNFIEETYEAVEAIDTDNMELLREELGDVLLQVLLHSEMASEQKYFAFEDVCNQLATKLVYRHPHVFGDLDAKDSEEALKNWDAMKEKEKGQETVTDTLNQASSALPALMYSEKVQKRAAKVGFDYPKTSDAFEHLYSELKELEQAMQENNSADIYEEYGDVLFSAVNLSRFIKVDAEHALYDATKKFIARFTEMEQLAEKQDIDVRHSDLEQLDKLWNQAKQNMKSQ